MAIAMSNAINIVGMYIGLQDEPFPSTSRPDFEQMEGSILNEKDPEVPGRRRSSKA